MSLPVLLSRKTAFSLVEVTLALGIIAFALVGIMALFPVAMKSARESQMETKATFIAKEIFSGLRPQGTSLTNQMSVLVFGEDFLSPNRFQTNLAAFGTNVVGYNDDGRPVGTVSLEAFDLALPDENWVYAVRVGVLPDYLESGVNRVEVLMTAPAAAPFTNRATFPFVTLMSSE